MSELPCPYCGFNCEIPSNIEEKIECPNCGSIFLYLQKSESHGTIDYRPSPEINDGSRQMSELKADKTFVFGEECEAYKKPEVDAVLAKKDKEIRTLRRGLLLMCAKRADAEACVENHLADLLLKGQTYKAVDYHRLERDKWYKRAVSCRAKAEEFK